MNASNRKAMIAAYSSGKAYVPEPSVLLSMAETMSLLEIAQATGIAKNLVSRKLALARELSNLPHGRKPYIKKGVDSEGTGNYPTHRGHEMTEQDIARYRDLIYSHGGYRKFAAVLGVSSGLVQKPIRENYMGRSMIERVHAKTGVRFG